MLLLRENRRKAIWLCGERPVCQNDTNVAVMNVGKIKLKKVAVVSTSKLKKS